MSQVTLPLSGLAYAKINLGLFVGPVRRDGRHELVSVMQSISLADRLTLSRAGPDACADEVDCPGVEGENLAGRALAVLRGELDWKAPPLRLSIDKRIPVAAGLAGGSADAAAALRLAGRAAGLREPGGLLAVARVLGADVPAQVVPGRWLATGAGETLAPLPDPSTPFGVLVLPLAQALSTPDVYRRADELSPPRPSSELERRRERLRAALAGGDQLPPAELLRNDLQDAAISLCPQIVQELQHVRAQGPEHALVSGSGPTVLGLFAGPGGPARARAAAAALASRRPPVAWAVPVGRAYVQARETASSGARRD